MLKNKQFLTIMLLMASYSCIAQTKIDSTTKLNNENWKNQIKIVEKNKKKQIVVILDDKKKDAILKLTDEILKKDGDLGSFGNFKKGLASLCDSTSILIENHKSSYIISTSPLSDRKGKLFSLIIKMDKHPKRISDFYSVDIKHGWRNLPER